MELLTTVLVAERLGVTIRTVHRMVDTGRLRAEFKLPGRTGAYLFRTADVDAALVETSAA